MKFQKKHSGLLFAVLMALILPLIMTFFITIINAGLSGRFLFLWMKAYLIAFIVALPSIIIVAPQIRKFIENITE